MNAASITPAQKSDLLRAIDSAVKPGCCQYVVYKQGDGSLSNWTGEKTPGCVVGQFAHQRGVQLDILEKWDRPGDNGWDGCGIGHLLTAKATAIHNISDVPREVLIKLQGIWDGNYSSCPDQFVDRLIDLAHKYEMTTTEKSAAFKAMAIEYVESLPVNG